MQGAAAKASPQEKEKPTPVPKRKSAAALKAEKAEKAKQRAAKVERGNMLARRTALSWGKGGQGAGCTRCAAGVLPPGVAVPTGLGC